MSHIQKSVKSQSAPYTIICHDRCTFLRNFTLKLSEGFAVPKKHHQNFLKDNLANNRTLTVTSTPLAKPASHDTKLTTQVVLLSVILDFSQGHLD